MTLPGLASVAAGGAAGGAAAADVLDAVAFAGYGIVLVAGAAFTYYALGNYALDRLEGHEDFWGYLTYLGIAVSVFGACGLALLAGAGRWVLAFSDVALLFAIAFVAFALREVYYRSALAPEAGERSLSLARVRALEFGFVVVVAAEWLVVVLLGDTATTAAVRGVGAVAFAAYGVAFSERLEALARGTTMDTLRRHLVFVLVAATGVAVADLAAVLAPGAVAESTGYVFLVLLGGLLVPPTIRLQQSIAGRT